MSRRLIVVACGLLLVSGGLRLAAATQYDPADQLDAFPTQVGSWQTAETFQLDSETARILNADNYLLRNYQRSAAPVSLFVAFYGSQRAGQTIHSPLNCLPGTGWEWVDRRRITLRTDGGLPIEVNRNIARRDQQNLLVYYWYQSRGRVVASDYTNKLLLVRDALALHRSDGALVRVTADLVPGRAAGTEDAATFIQTVYPALTAHLPE